MPFGNDHEMAVIVRIAIENDRMVSCPEKDEIAFIFFVTHQRTKKTAVTFTGARAQVGLAPRSPHEVRGSLEFHEFLGVMGE